MTAIMLYMDDALGKEDVLMIFDELELRNSPWLISFSWRRIFLKISLETFRLEYEDDYEYEFQVLSTRNSKIFALQT